MYKLLLFSILIFLSACANVNSVSTKDKAQEIVEKAIEKHGGMEEWKNIKQVSFEKSTQLFLADGQIEKQTHENQQMEYLPSLRGHIAPVDLAEDYTISFKDGKGTKITNGETSDGTNAFLSAHFVINLPFKLLDPDVTLSYEGIDTLETGVVVDVVKAFYGDEKDTWWVYFDKEEHHIVANLIYHAPTYAYVVNNSMDVHQGFIWNAKRTTYRCDKDRNIEYVRARFEYGPPSFVLDKG